MSPRSIVMNEILGGGFGSRLFQKVRTQLGLAYAVGGGFSLPYDHPGIVPRRSPHQKCLHRRCNQGGSKPRSPASTPSRLPRKSCSAPRTTSSTHSSSDYDTKDKILDESEKLEFYGYPADYLETYHAALEKVTLADLTAAAKKYIHPEKLAVLVVGNGPEIKPGLDALGMGAPQPIDITIPQPPGAPRQAARPAIARSLKPDAGIDQLRIESEQRKTPGSATEKVK